MCVFWQILAFTAMFIDIPLRGQGKRASYLTDTAREQQAGICTQTDRMQTLHFLCTTLVLS